MTFRCRNASLPSILWLYRSYIRQTRQLPHNYLRLFFRLKGRDDFHAILWTRNESLRKRKLKRVFKELQKLHGANSQNHKAFAHILDIAYGRKGPLKWELMEPLLSDPKALQPLPIIPGKEKSRPPVYSPELKALLSSGLSRKTGSTLESKHFISPPTLPERANPASQQAALVGPFSKRREVNIRWRFFEREWKKLLPPLQASVTMIPASEDSTIERSDSVAQIGIRGFGFQSTEVLQELHGLAGQPWLRQSRAAIENPSAQQQREDTYLKPYPPLNGLLPTRWLRRRYQSLLGKLPVLNYTYRRGKDGHNEPGRYEVHLARSALVPSRSQSAVRLAGVDDESMAWIRHATVDITRKKKRSDESAQER